MESQDEQEGEMILPLSALRSGAGGFLSWITSLTNKTNAEILRKSQAKQIDNEELQQHMLRNQARQSALSEINAK